MKYLDKDLAQISAFLNQQSPDSLPGLSAQLLMAPPMRAEEIERMDPDKPHRLSAILILLFEEEGEIKTLMMKRSSRLHHHAGQISFPGGQVEKQDKNGWETAIRETEEETGIPRTSIQYVQRLSDLFIPPSNFNVEVYVGMLKNLPTLSPNKDEVDELLKVSMDFFMHTSAIENRMFDIGKGRLWEAPSYIYHAHTIWGASAMMMSELVEILKKMPTKAGISKSN